MSLLSDNTFKYLSFLSGQGRNSVLALFEENKLKMPCEKAVIPTITNESKTVYKEVEGFVNILKNSFEEKSFKLDTPFKQNMVIY